MGHLKSNRLRGRMFKLQGDGIQFFLAVFRQVGAFGLVLANQAIDVSFLARCQGLCGSQKWMATPVF